MIGEQELKRRLDEIVRADYPAPGGDEAPVLLEAMKAARRNRGWNRIRTGSRHWSIPSTGRSLPSLLYHSSRLHLMVY